jgi:hypothetical protein
MNRPFFKFFKTYSDILEFCWNEFGFGDVNGCPDQSVWDKNTNASICDIRYWEQIYHDPGNFGIYAAHDPLVEFYIVVYYPVVDDNFNGILEFQGDSAIEKLLMFADKLNVSLLLTPTKQKNI